jgi:hypothetical protein
MNKLEFKKAESDALKHGFGLYDTGSNLRVKADNLIFLYPRNQKRMMAEEVKLRRELVRLEKIYRGKYKTLDIGGSMHLGLFNKDIEGFVERFIRATEICTMRYVLGVGGGLNLFKEQEIVKGHRKFIWEI